MNTQAYYNRNKQRILNKRRRENLTTSEGVAWKGLKKRPHPKQCELCGSEKNVKLGPIRLEWHHWIEANPNIGLWMCYRCHRFAEFCDKYDVGLMFRTYETLKGEAYEMFRLSQI